MTEEKKINDILKTTWFSFKEQYVSLILATLITVFGSFLIFTLAPLIYGLYATCIKMIKGQKIEATDVFVGFNEFVKSWILFIIILILTVLGFIALVIPGIIISILLQYAFAVSILEKKSAIDSIKRSYQISKDNFALSTIIWIIFSTLGTIGAATYAGLFLTVPIAALLIVTTTIKLTGKKFSKKNTINKQ